MWKLLLSRVLDKLITPVELLMTNMLWRTLELSSRENSTLPSSPESASVADICLGKGFVV